MCFASMRFARGSGAAVLLHEAELYCAVRRCAVVYEVPELPGSGGTWMVVAGGMGSRTQQLAAAALNAGARGHRSPVQQIELQDGRATGQWGSWYTTQVVPCSWCHLGVVGMQ